MKLVAVAGAKTTLTVQEAPGASDAPQVPPAAPAGRENGCGDPPPNVKVPPASATVPVLVTVRVLALLVVPLAQFPNASGLGDTAAVVAIREATNSTAPASTDRPGADFLGLP